MAITITRTAPPNPPTGVTAVAVHGWDICYNTESGSLVDRTSEFTAGATPVDSFLAVNDYIYFGFEASATATTTAHDGRFLKIYVKLLTPASTSIAPTFEYSSSATGWTSLGVTDGTNGFTQNGTITVNLATLPSYTQWVRGGQSIGDGVLRNYVRIKRTAATLTTAPKIEETGTGMLTAGKEYFYVLQRINNDPHYVDSRNRMRSAPTTEVSATTTNYKRCIKISWTPDAYLMGKMIWRSPTSGNYDGAGSNFQYVSDDPGLNAIDDYAYQVKGQYFSNTSGNTREKDYQIDDGLAGRFTRVGTQNRVYSTYCSYYFQNYSVGSIRVQADAGTPASFEDIYNEDVANGWNTFIKKEPEFENTNYNVYECRDNLYIDGYFEQDRAQIHHKGSMWSNANANMVFGRKRTFTLDQGEKNWYPDRGVVFVAVGSIAHAYRMRWVNAKFYSCRFVQEVVDPFLQLNSYLRTYINFPEILGDGCEMHNVIIEGDGMLEAPLFGGTNLVLDNVVLNAARYGLTIGVGASPTMSVNNVEINADVGLNIAHTSFADGDTGTLRNLKFGHILSAFSRCYLNAGSQNNTVVVNLVNPTFNTTANGRIEKGNVGINYTINEQYELAIKVIDREGNPLENATVKVEDNNGTEIFSKSTAATGKITDTDITWKKYLPGTLFNAAYYSYYADDVTEYSYHTITISKSGYITQTHQMAMNENRGLIFTLEQVKDINLSKRISIHSQARS